MAKINEVLEMLIPNGGYFNVGEDYEGITFLECKPITKKQFTDGFAQFDAWKAQQESMRLAQRQALLDRLGISAEEAQLLLGGN